MRRLVIFLHGADGEKADKNKGRSVQPSSLEQVMERGGAVRVWMDGFATRLSLSVRGFSVSG